MEIILSAMGRPIASYRTDDRLKELSFGAWGGMTMEEVAKNNPENYARRQADVWNVAPPEGERFCDFYKRVMRWFGDVTRNTVAVAHGGVNRCLRGHFLGLTPEQMVHLDVPQDKVLMIEGGTLTWL